MILGDFGGKVSIAFGVFTGWSRFVPGGNEAPMNKNNNIENCWKRHFGHFALPLIVCFIFMK